MWPAKTMLKNMASTRLFWTHLLNRLLLALFRNARNHFSDHWVLEFIDIATNPGRVEQVSIEQGSHQPEDLTGGGFACISQEETTRAMLSISILSRTWTARRES